MGEPPAPLVGIGLEILHHVFVDFFLQIDANGPIGADDLVRTNPGVGRDISAGVRNAHIRRDVANGVMRTFGGGGDELTQELLTGRSTISYLRCDADNDQHAHQR
jgi:hypothetical protein